MGTPRRLVNLTTVAVVALALPLLGQLGWLAHAFGARMRFPLDIEWCEGGMILHAHRLLQGLPLYGPSEAVFRPFPYPPGCAAVLALVGSIHLDYSTARLVSVCFYALFCVVACLAVRGAVAERALGWGLGLLAAALVTTTYAATGSCGDLVRVDAMLLGLMALALQLVSPAFPPDQADPRPLGRGRLVALAAVLSLAVLTKQTAALWSLWILAALAWRDWRRAALVGLLHLASVGAVVGLLQWTSDGWFWRWVVIWPARHQLHHDRWAEGLLLTLQASPWLALVPLALVPVALRRFRSPRALLWALSLLICVPIGLVPYAKDGGWINNLAPMLMVGQPAALLVAVALIRGLWSPPARRAAMLLLLAVGSGYVALGGHRAGVFVPDAADLARAQALNDYVARLPGTVAMPHAPFVPVRNGKGPEQWHAAGYDDAARVGVGGAGHAGAIAATRPDWVILPTPDAARMLPWGYEPHEPLDPAIVHRPAVGWPVTPDLLVRRVGPPRARPGTP